MADVRELLGLRQGLRHPPQGGDVTGDESHVCRVVPELGQRADPHLVGRPTRRRLMDDLDLDRTSGPHRFTPPLGDLLDHPSRLQVAEWRPVHLVT